MNEIITILETLPARIRVIFTSLLTYLIAAQTIATVVVAQGEALGLPDAVEYGGLALTGLAAAITFIRRVTPVASAERGVLPVESELG